MLRGLLAWGLPMFITMAFVVNEAFDESALIISHVVINAIVWTIGGLLFGAAIGCLPECKYKKLLVKKKEKKHTSHLNSNKTVGYFFAHILAQNF